MRRLKRSRPVLQTSPGSVGAALLARSQAQPYCGRPALVGAGATLCAAGAALFAAGSALSSAKATLGAAKIALGYAGAAMLARGKA